MITPADILAVQDIVNDVADESESHTAVEAIAMRQALEQLISAARGAISVLDTHAIKSLDGQSVVVGNTRYWEGSKGSYRAQHSKIGGLVILRASEPDDNGEVPTAHDAAKLAVAMMTDIYVSPSTPAKVGALEHLSIDPQAVRTWKDSGSRVLKDEPAPPTREKT